MTADTTTRSDLFFVPGNHLYPLEHLLPYKQATIVMAEDQGICRRRRYHQQKLALLLGAMRDYRAALVTAGFELRYAELSDDETLTSALTDATTAKQASRLITFAVTDHALRAVLKTACAKLQLTWQEVADPAFMTSKATFAEFAEGKRHVRMADFYKRQRKTLDVLVSHDGQPIGDQWSFDAQNRKKVPARQTVPELPQVTPSDGARSAIATVRNSFADHPGNAERLWLPTTHKGAHAWLNDFLEHRFRGFGTYEDAISTRSPTLFHTALSPLINLGLITPDTVVRTALAHAERADIALNDVEGLVRQIIGWREFIRGVYDTYAPRLRTENVRKQRRGLTDHWYNGSTGIAPLDLAIAHQDDMAWNHHINRLMVIANLMNLCEIDPQQVYEYFMQHYLDAYDWVMVPNVYGMGLNSDDGVFATKPYICGSNYLLKMSDIKRGDWCDTVDGLYWRFVERNRTALAQNPRLAAFVSGVDRLDPTRKTRIFAAAEEFLERCTQPAF